MLEHLENIINDIKLIKQTNEYILENIDINYLENSIIELKTNIEDNIDLKKIKKISEIIYKLNLNNNFSKITDHISNEFYAFEFMLEKKLKMEKYK